MSTLAIILAVGMVIGSGPEKVTGEMEENLHLQGDWVGESWGDDGVVWQVKLRDGDLCFSSGKEVASPLPVAFIVDEGHGRFRVDWPLPGDSLGIYKQEGDHLVMCCRDGHQGRPTSFRLGSGQLLLILNRVKPRK